MIKINPKNKITRIICRITLLEQREIINKANIYTKGNVSKYMREALINYNRNKKGEL